MTPIAIRVLVPFGVMAEKAAEGCWAEAFRLVLTPPPDSSTTAHTNAATGGSICSRDENGGDNNGGGGDSSSIGIRSSSDHGSGRRGRRDGDQEGDAGEYAAGKQQGAERIMAMDLPGGRWNAVRISRHLQRKMRSRKCPEPRRIILVTPLLLLALPVSRCLAFHTFSRCSILPRHVRRCVQLGTESYVAFDSLP